MFNNFNYVSADGRDWSFYRNEARYLPLVAHPHGAGFAPFLEVAYGFLMFDVLPQIENMDTTEISYKFNGCVENSSFTFEFEVNGYIIRICTLYRARVLLVINPAKNDVVFDINLYNQERMN